jgi:hypothetical protein
VESVGLTDPLKTTNTFVIDGKRALDGAVSKDAVVVITDNDDQPLLKESKVSDKSFENELKQADESQLPLPSTSDSNDSKPHTIYSPSAGMESPVHNGKSDLSDRKHDDELDDRDHRLEKSPVRNIIDDNASDVTSSSSEGPSEPSDGYEGLTDEYEEAYGRPDEEDSPRIRALVEERELETNLALEQSYDEVDALSEREKIQSFYGHLTPSPDDSEGEARRKRRALDDALNDPDDYYGCEDYGW